MVGDPGPTAGDAGLETQVPRIRPSPWQARMECLGVLPGFTWDESREGEKDGLLMQQKVKGEPMFFCCWNPTGE